MIVTFENLIEDQIKRINNMTVSNSFTEWLKDIEK